MQIKFTFGAMTESLSEQCRKQKLVARGLPCETADKIAHGLTMALIHNILTDNEVSRARNRLIKAMCLVPDGRQQ